MIEESGQNGGRIEPCPRIMKKKPHAIDQQDAPPGAEGREEAGREFIFPENPEKDRRRPVTEGRFLEINRRFQPRRDIVAGGVHRAGDGAVPPFIRLHEGGEWKRNQIKQQRNQKKNDYFDGPVLHDQPPGMLINPQFFRECLFHGSARIVKRLILRNGRRKGCKPTCSSRKTMNCSCWLQKRAA